MKKLLIITSFLASQLFAVQCTEQQYSPFFTDKQEVRYMYSHYQTADNSNVVIDKKNIVYDKKNQKITCWVISQMIWSPEYAVAKIQWEFNLKNNQNRILSGTLYNCTGAPVNSTSEKGHWEDIVPESSNEFILNNLKKYLNIKQ